MRALVMLVFFALAAVGIVYAVQDSLASGLVASPSAAPPATLSMTLVGTIDYQLNNAGAPVPYLVYRSDGVKTKALIFDSTSVCATASGTYPCALIADALAAYYGGNPVEAEGTIEAENLLVSRLAPAPPSAV